MPRTLAAAIALAAIASNVGCADAQGPKKYESPNAVFEASNAAAQKKDYKTFLQCLTPDTLDRFSGLMITGAIMSKKALRDDGSEGMFGTVKAVKGLLDKYGLKDDVIEKVGLDDATKMNPRSEAELRKVETAWRNLGKLVKDRPAFLEDMSKARDAADPRRVLSIFDSNVVLKDVKVDGNSAKATASDAQGEATLYFQKIDGGWKMDLQFDGGRPAQRERKVGVANP